MRALFPLLLLSSALATPPIPVANTHTPSTLVNSLAVGRDWTLQESDFCKARAAVNASGAYPSKPTSRFKFIKTFAFRAASTASNERVMINFTRTGFQTTFPWQDGQWLSRQYTSEATPRYTYLLELQDRPKAPGAYNTVASACITVFGVR